jgi:hypothetical protein
MSLESSDKQTLKLYSDIIWRRSVRRQRPDSFSGTQNPREDALMRRVSGRQEVQHRRAEYVMAPWNLPTRRAEHSLAPNPRLRRGSRGTLCSGRAMSWGHWGIPSAYHMPQHRFLTPRRNAAIDHELSKVPARPALGKLSWRVSPSGYRHLSARLHQPAGSLCNATSLLSTEV